MNKKILAILKLRYFLIILPLVMLIINHIIHISNEDTDTYIRLANYFTRPISIILIVAIPCRIYYKLLKSQSFIESSKLVKILLLLLYAIIVIFVYIMWTFWYFLVSLILDAIVPNSSFLEESFNLTITL